MILKKTTILCSIILSLAVLTTLGPVTSNPFLAYEDWLFVTRNSVVQAGLTWAGIEWAFSTFHTGNWYPLTWLSHMLDAQLYGLNPRGHHLTNLALHWVNTLLLYFFLARATRSAGKSAWVAILFAIHPLHVESVAWVSERKDLLSTFFGLLAMVVYHRYVRSQSLLSYLSVVSIFVCGLMSKPMLVTLPCVLLLLDLWPFRRFQDPHFSWKRVLGEKIPLLSLSALFSVVTVIAQQSADAVAGLDVAPFDTRIKNSILAYVIYLKKTAFPIDLAAFYPYPTAEDLSWWNVGAALLLLLGISAVAMRAVRSRPYLAFGWCWYLGTLVPVIGLVQVGSQAYADRYTYIPSIGVFIAVVWGLWDLASQYKTAQRIVVPVAIALLLLLASLTRQQITLWNNDVSLFRHAIAVTRDNYLARNLLGLGYVSRGQREEARACFERSIELEPHFAEAHNNLGMVLSELGRLETAKQSFQNAIRLNPQMAKAYANLAGVYFQEHNYEAAASNYLQALRVDPFYALACRNLGITFYYMGRHRDALQSFEQALTLQPHDEISLRHIRMLRTDPRYQEQP